MKNSGRNSIELVCQSNSQNRAVIQQIPRLNQAFTPTPWLFNEHLQMIWLGLKKVFGARLEYDRIDELTMPDGGLTTLYWLGMDLHPDTPTIVILHTISGSYHSMRGLVRDLHRLTGWRIVLCQRRGHGGQPLAGRRFNTMGDVDDLSLQLKHITSTVPASPLFAIGVSAGTGLLIRHLGSQGTDTPFKAAFAYCPGYDIRTAFQRAKPFYSRAMTKKLLKNFIVANETVFQSLDSYPQLASAKDLDGFHRNLYECAGYSSYQAYLEDCNPVAVMEGVAVPLLVLNAADDPVCVMENVHEHRDQVAKIPSAVLAITRKGSHCAHFSGWDAKPWAHQLVADYFRAVYQSFEGK
ncbi:YheT family hydrolase [Marinobacter nauticus]|uniref:YheT family hydrolase n=1 Tax=Marinobacter TaxID=2742 RepID=UPI001C95B92B|nr:alpha/beta fold hydrolase [Marinobacter nauticus]MBY6220723.1 alpha/beta fold hydrolase [Marinobacter nauticus]MCC4272447.1 alpha/beta hydrolase [Marinobacter nauticus]